MQKARIAVLLIVSALIGSAADEFLIADADAGRVCAVRVDGMPDATLAHAVRELKSHVKRMTGLDLSDDGASPDGERIVLKSAGGDDEGFSVEEKDGVLTIAGEGSLGVLYGVYDLLEREGGCGWFTPFRTVVPTRRRFAVRRGTRWTDRPAFAVRQPSWYGVRTNRLFAARCRFNGESPDGETDPAWLHLVTRRRFVRPLYSSHTTLVLVPPEKYFDTHPEYFSEIGGRRIREATQLCMTNPEVADVAAENALAFAAADPEGRIVGVSQMDWGNFCTCASCAKLVREEGSLAGLTVHFANEVARRIARVRPDLMVETLVYVQTLVPPKTVRPRPDVIVCSCTSADYAEPLATATRERNVRWKEQYETWTRFTGKMMQWDYTPNFRWFFLPHPNVPVYGPNLRYFRDRGVWWAYMDGIGIASSDFGDLRNYVLAKLTWNPDLDTDALVDRFCTGVYGAGAPFARQAYDLENATFAPHRDLPLTYGSEDMPEVYTDDYFRRVLALWTAAERAVGANDEEARFAIRQEKYHALCALVWRNAPEAADCTDELRAIRAEAAARKLVLRHSLQRGQDAWFTRKVTGALPRQAAVGSRVELGADDWVIRDGDYSGGQWNERHGMHTRRVSDPTARDGVAIDVLPHDGLDAIRYFPTPEAVAAGKSRRVKVRARLPYETTAEGAALSVVVKRRGQVKVERQVSGTELGPEWSWIDVGEVCLDSESKLDIRGALSGTGTATAVRVDTIVIE